MSNVIGWPLLAAIFVGTALAFIAGAVVLRLMLGRFRDRFGETVEHELRAAFVFTDVSHLFWLNLIIVVAAVGLTFWLTGLAAPAVVVALVLSVVPRLLLRSMRRRRVQAFRQQMPEIMSLLSVSLKAGSALNSALIGLAEQMPAPARHEFSMVLREQRMGRSLDAALESLETRMPVEETMLLVSALRLSLRAGGSLAQTLHTLSEAMRRRLMLEGKIRALTAQGRMQAWVMGLLPFAVMGALLVMQPEMAHLYFDTTEGLAVLALVGLMQLAGGWMIARMVAIEV